MKKIYHGALLSSFIISFAQSAIASQEVFPKLTGAFTFEVENDNLYHSDDPDNELNDLYITIDSVLNVNFTKKISVLGNLVLEPVLDPQAADDRTFEDHGVYLASLVMQWQGEKLGLFAGKFTPLFGMGWDRAAGIYSTEFAEDYETSEQIGIGGSYSFSCQNSGEHTLTFSSFWSDTSSFSDSIITKRGRTTKSAGGVGNTEDLSSFAIALEGSQMPALPEAIYHLAYIKQAGGETETADQSGFAIGLEYPLSISETLVTPLLEYVHYHDVDGSPEMQRSYLTTSLSAQYHNYNLAFGYSFRTTEESGAPDIDDELYQLSAGYAFENGISLDAGWKTDDVEGITSDTIGIILSYSIEF